MRSVGERCARFAMRPTIEKSITASQQWTTQDSQVFQPTLPELSWDASHFLELSRASYRELPLPPLPSSPA